MKPEPKKGELSDEYGLFVGRPFHIVSELPSRRYLDVVRNKPVIKIDNGRDSQKWMFDWNTRSIKNLAGRKYALTMNSRKNTQLYLSKSKSEWYNMFRYVNKQFTNISRNYSLDVAGKRDQEGNVVMLWPTRKG